MSVYTTRKILMALSLCILPAFPMAGQAQDQRVQVVRPDSLFAFPLPDEDILLAHPVSMTADGRDTLYISDHFLSQILVFSAKGAFLRAFGDKGQGPGEFVSPLGVVYSDGTIYINDQANRRIQWLSTKGHYIGSLKIRDIPRAFTVHKNKLYVLNLNSQLHWSDEPQKKDDLVHVFDEKGRTLLSFGNHLDFYFEFHDLLTPDISTAYIKVFDEKIYLLFKYFPFLRVYSKTGKLLDEFTFAMSDYQRRIKTHYDLSRFKRKVELLPFKVFIAGLEVNRHGVFVGIEDKERIIVDHYTHDGHFVTRYSFDMRQRSFRMRDFLVLDAAENENVLLYVLNNGDFPQVEVYRLFQEQGEE